MIIRADTATPQYETGARSPTVLTNSRADRSRPGRALLLVQHREGYRRLCELLTRAYRDNLYRSRPEIDPAWFLEGTDGLLALSGGVIGIIMGGIILSSRRI